MTDRLALLALFLLALLLPAPAFAACSGPAGNAGDMMYNSVNYQYCNGTTWIAMGPGNGSGSGSGCTGPAGNAGDLIYNSAYHLYQFCAGQWIAMGPTGAGGTCGGPTSGLVGWWKLTDGSGTSAADSSGNGNTGTLEATPTWITTGPPNGGGLTLNGSTQYVDVPGSAFNLTGSWTISSWVNLSSFPAGATNALLAKDDTGGCTNYALYADNDSGNFGASSGWIVSYNVTGACSTNYYAEDLTSISTGTWYLLTGVYNSSTTTLTLYLNGASVASTNVSGHAPDGAGGIDLNLGAENGTGGNQLAGSIDDERVYNTALTAAQVAALYSYPSGNEGDIIYNSTNKIMEYCNGTWVGMGY